MPPMAGKLTMQDLTVELEALARPTNPADLFDSPGPVELEVGIGKGGFLLEQAKARPNVNFFGIEWSKAYYRYAADRFVRWGLTNVRVMRTDARAFVEVWLAPACVQAMHAYFPDPWPKKRHHKRRFFRPRTVEAVVRSLLPGGHLYTATDYVEYFDIIRELLLGRADLVEVEFPTDFGQPGEVVGTNYERKYVREGRTIYRLAMRKIEAT